MALPILRSCENGGTEGREARKRRLDESRREREFYSYFESVLAYASKEPKSCDLRNPEAAASHRATSSSDKTLTSFAQLAALRIGTRRAMIFFFDSDNAYVFAESTRTLSLQNDSHHAPGDSLWLGFTKIPRGLSVCEVTANLPANEGSNAQDPETRSIAHIVNNLTEDTRFCDRPYVLDGPKARFYAGVPITTPKGINIGALCVLDDKPRDGLELSQVEFLRSLASTIMSHLELVFFSVNPIGSASSLADIYTQLRSKEDNQRSRDMNTALGAFVEGKSDSRDWWHGSRHASTDAQGRPESGSSEARLNTFNNRVPTTPRATDHQMENATLDEYFASKGSLGTIETCANPIAGRPPTHDPQPPAIKQPQMETAVSSRPTLGSRGGSDGSASSREPSHTRDDKPQKDLPARVKATATRAACLIQKGVCADGVLFLDATVGSFGGLINGAQGLSQTETETDASHPSDAGNPTQSENRQKTKPVPTVTISEPPKHSVVLGSAYSSDIESRVREAIQQAKFSEKVLRSLLRRYPDGQVWHFDVDGNASDEDEYVSDEYLSSTSAGESAGSELEQATTPSSKRAAKKIYARKKDGRAIQEIFPGIRSLVFLGMWNPHQERWFGASVVLSYSSTRMFSVRNELSYLTAFCDVVLGEIWRLEAQELGRSKNDFISSISHELRSPLHGILGSAECLEEQEQSALSYELIRSISSCGTTLLDVVSLLPLPASTFLVKLINDLLEYSRLNHGTQKRRKIDLPKTSNMSSDASAASNASEVESGVMISTLTEDAVNAACLGFDHQSVIKTGTSGPGDEHSATLTLNIEESQNSDWLFSLASGSWKRICLNLVLNALKYTPCGYISVTLRKKWLQERTGREQAALVELVVEDSGIGMSDDFQAKSLFRPFKQENSLTPGTGLGLNLVAQIVKSHGGTVNVRSSKGVGTTVRVSLPLRRPPSVPSTKTSTNLFDFEFSSASVGFLGFGAIETDSTTESRGSKADKLFLSSLKRCCKQLGLPVCATDDALDNHASVYVVREQELERLFKTNDKDSRRSFLSTDNLREPIVVICTTRDSALKLRSTPIAISLPRTTQYLWLPIGPAKLAGALWTCCMYHEQTTLDFKVIEPGEADLQLVNPCTDNQSAAAPLGAMQTSFSTRYEEAGISARIPPPIIEGPPARGASKDGKSSNIDAIDAVVDHDDLQVSQRPLHKRSCSEAATRASTPSIRIRTQIDRAITVPYHSAGALSLLLVDDNAINLRLLEVFAKKAGHIYHTAQNGEEAVEIYEAAARKDHRSDDPLGQSLRLVGKPEVVLMDINMPVMDGFEATRAIRRFEKTSGSPRATIIALTGLGDMAAQEQSFTSGMDLFLTKPVKMKELTEILAKVQSIDL